jgi:putative tricarboxylic transport membrane protein
MTTLISYQNDWTVFFTRPVSGVILLLSFIALVFPFIRTVWGRLRPAESTP